MGDGRWERGEVGEGRGKRKESEEGRRERRRWKRRDETASDRRREYIRYSRDNEE